MTADLHYLSLEEVARRLKSRKLSSVETTQAILDRIGKLDARLKSYATLTAEKALADAAARDAETDSGKSRGPLCAVECAIAHEATYPSRAGDYGAVLAALIESGRKLSGMEMARLQLSRAALAGELGWPTPAAIPRWWRPGCATPPLST